MSAKAKPPAVGVAPKPKGDTSWAGFPDTAARIAPTPMPRIVSNFPSVSRSRRSAARRSPMQFTTARVARIVSETASHAPPSSFHRNA
jgi:hypothetical protein